MDLQTIKPGTTLNCTVSKLPRTPDQEATIARLMRLDPTNKKALRRAQRMRRQRMVEYNRGNRMWVKREKTAKVVRVELGQNWSMPFTFDKIADLRAIEGFVQVKADK